jgi:hypothetical protein
LIPRATQKATNLSLTVVILFVVTNLPYIVDEFMRQEIFFGTWWSDSWLHNSMVVQVRSHMVDGGKNNLQHVFQSLKLHESSTPEHYYLQNLPALGPNMQSLAISCGLVVILYCGFYFSPNWFKPFPMVGIVI